jgi:hypothetical protein
MHALDTIPVGFEPLKLEHAPYSASKLLVASCPARFQGRYVLKDRIIADTHAAARGSAIHLVLEYITRAWLNEETITPEIINRWVEESIGKFPAAYDNIKMVKDAAVRYLANPPKNIIKSTVQPEVRLAVKRVEEPSFMDDVTPQYAYVKVPHTIDGKPNPEAYFSGIMDLLWVDEEIKTVFVLDHKSTPSASDNSDFQFQLGCYAFLASLFYPGYKIGTILHYAHPELDFYAPPVFWEEEDLFDIEQEVHMRIRGIESFVEYPALPGTPCTYCHMVQQCPEYMAIEAQNARGGINLNARNTDELQKLAGQLLVTGKLYDQMNKTLKQALEDQNLSGIAVNGTWFGFKAGDKSVDWAATEVKIKQEVERAKLTPENPESVALIEMGDLAGMLKKYGVTPDAFKNWNGSKLKALWKLDKPELMQLMGKFVVYDKSTRFSGYKL